MTGLDSVCVNTRLTSAGVSRSTRRTSLAGTTAPPETTRRRLRRPAVRELDVSVIFQEGEHGQHPAVNVARVGQAELHHDAANVFLHGALGHP
jgi:hypothetical protein